MNEFAVEVVNNFRIDEECHRHLHCLTRLQNLFCEAEAVDFGKKSARRKRGDVVTGGSGDSLICRVMGFVKGQPDFADTHFHLALHRFKGPGHIAV